MIIVTIDKRSKGQKSQEAGDLIPWSSHIKHDVADEIIVEGESCLNNGNYNYYHGTTSIVILVLFLEGSTTLRTLTMTMIMILALVLQMMMTVW